MLFTNRKVVFLIDIEFIKEEAMKELARREFFFYCNYFYPNHYKEERTYLKDLCYKLQDFVYRKDKKILIINLPPRHYKSFTATNFVAWLLGQNPKLKIMTGSYNETLSTTFAKQVRDRIAEQKSAGIRSYSDIFPNTKIKYGQAAMNKWSLEGDSQDNYLATSPTGTSTGFGANILIIDDLIKNAEEAFNENVLEKHINWFNNTMLSRLEGDDYKIIIIMTRWATNDLAGYILKNYDKKDIEHINYKAYQDDKSMLCDEILSFNKYETITKNMDKSIVYANYQQEPIDIKGRLYNNLKTYTDIPKDKIRAIKSYCDTADTGSDYLCNIVYADCKDSAYILDVIYTKEPMEITEPLVSRALKEHEVNVADIESNNGGRAFARNVERITRDLGNYKTVISWFHQSDNKKARILSNSSWVQNNIYFPNDWANKYPEFYKAVITYQKEGKNLNDDAPDVLTGICEKMTNNIKGINITRPVISI